MAARRAPVTAAIRALRASGVEYTEHVYDYQRYPGAAGAAEFIGVDPHLTAKTIVFTADDGSGAVVLMHGDREVSTKRLAREMGVKTARPATQREADHLTGYRFGGTSPLGMRTDSPVYAPTSLADLDRVYVNAGSRGLVVGLKASALIELTGAILVNVAVD